MLYYVPRGGSPPFRRWREELTDKVAKLAITARLARLRGGNFSDSKPVGEGVSESRVDLGPGYRIYFGIYGTDIILLHGGDKSTQRRDIVRAKEFWRDFKERKNEEKRRLQSRPSGRAPK